MQGGGRLDDEGLLGVMVGGAGRTGCWPSMAGCCMVRGTEGMAGASDLPACMGCYALRLTLVALQGCSLGVAAARTLRRGG